MEIAGQRIVIVGGGSGIGRAIAAAARAEGAEVIVVGRRRRELEATAALVGATVQVADVTVESEVEELFDRIGEFHHLVSTASQTAAGKIGAVERAAVEKAMAAKLWAPQFLIRHGLKRMTGAGSFTFFSGFRAARPAAGSSITSMVNGGLEAFAKAMAVELGPVRVNVVSPGIVDSGGFWERLGEAGRAKVFGDYAGKVPAGRVGAVEELASAALFAMGNPFVTGAILAVDGGGLIA